MNANKQDAGGLPMFDDVVKFLLGEAALDGHWFGDGFAPLVAGKYPAQFWWRSVLRRAYGELCRAAPAGGDVECFVREMRTSKGPEFFVVVRCNGRELTPHMYTERWKAEYDVASWQHLLCGAPEPDLLAYGPSEDSAPAGSGEELAKWVEGARDYVTGGNVRPDDGDEDQEQWDRLTEAAALLRKLQQGAE